MKHVLLALALAACLPSIPAEPSFQQDILPILAANCVRCHGYPTIGGASASFRLDAFDDVIVRPGSPDANTPCGLPEDPAAQGVLCGAVTQSRFSALRTQDTFYPMPPRFPLDDYQIDVLDVWSRNPTRGAPRRNNQAPAMEIEEVVRSGESFTLRVRINDADGDLVAGSLHAQIGTARVLVGVLRSGPQQLTWTATGVASGTYPLIATLDDGAEPRIVTLGTIEIGGGS